MRKLLLALLLFSLALVGCQREGGIPANKPLPKVRGSGATLPLGLLERWVTEYGAKTGRKVAYRGVGSSKGIDELTMESVDFAASDVPMTDDELVQSGPVLHIPVTVGAVAVVYNLPEYNGELRLPPDVLSGIWLGTITRWSDPRISQNASVGNLPDLPIVVIVRSDGSGTTNVFTDYLSRVSTAFAERVGRGNLPSWPVGTGADGNLAVARAVKEQPGAIGYVTLNAARSYNLETAKLRNREGKWVAPTLDSITAAAMSAKSAIPDDLRGSLVDAPGADAYPVVSFSYLLVRQEIADRARAEGVAAFIDWALRDGQRYAPGLHFATLPPDLEARSVAMLKQLHSGGQPVLQ